MSLLILSIVALTSTVIVFCWRLLFYVIPAYRKYKKQECLAILSGCLKKLNEGPLVTGEIHKGQYLHDRFYKLLFNVLTHKVGLKFSALLHVSYDQETEDGSNRFRSEINKLDKDARNVIDEALTSISKIIFYQNPILILLMVLKLFREKKTFDLNKKHRIRNTFINSSKITVIRAREDDYIFTPMKPALAA